MAFHGIHIKPSHKGLFHKDVGKKAGAAITEKDIEKGLHSKDPAERKRANFARNARKWHHPKKRTEGERASKVYGAGSKSKRETTSKANHPKRLPK